jgi:UDP-2,3-diacylglucosamine pyrophosphatase LpxH
MQSCYNHTIRSVFMKKSILYPIAATATLFTFGFIAWAFSLHGTYGLVHVESFFRYIFIGLGGTGAVLLVLLLLHVWLKRKRQAGGLRALAIPLLVLAVLLIIIPAFAFVYLNGMTSAKAGDVSLPLIAISDTGSKTLHIAVGSDAHFGAGTNRNDLTAQMLDQISSPDNGYVYFFFLGDLVENGFQGSNWKAALQALSTTTSTIPTVFAAGNHDTLFVGFNNYKKYCYPTGLDSQSGSQLWHRIDTGKIHFLILDIEWSAESYTAQQAAWLEEQLKDIPADDWKIVMSHGFYYASGSVAGSWRWYDNPETIEALSPLFEKYGVDIVFSGHNHQLELLEKSGVTYVICGGFGGLPDPVRTYTSPASLWYTGEVYGFADVTIDEAESCILFRDSSYNILRSFTIAK